MTAPFPPIPTGDVTIDFAEKLVRARALHREGYVDQAVPVYLELLKLEPEHPDANYLLGAADFQRGDFHSAQQRFERALKSEPGHTNAWFNLGNTQREMKRFEAALDSFDAVIELTPEDAAAHCNRGATLHELGRIEEAIASLGRATELDPGYATAHYLLGNTQQDLGDLEAAVLSYRRVLELDPHFPFLPGTLLHLRMRICDWNDFDESLAAIVDSVHAGKRASPVLPLIALSDSLDLHRRAAAIWGTQRTAMVSGVTPLSPTRPGERIRVGYFSSDFHEHATAYLMAEMFELHDKGRFEISAFTWGESAGPMRARLRKAFDHFLDISDLSDREVADLSRSMSIDIAIDLKGYTAQSRPAIFAHRAAPVQASYLGFPGTLALPCIDYLIADHVVVPAESRPFYTESLAFLRGSYQVNDSKRTTKLSAARRAAHGLPETALVFCSFNNNYKILPEIFASWMRILKAVDRSVLWIFQDNLIARQNLIRHAQEHRVDPSRLVFAQRVPMLDHLERQQLGDLFLDTYPCNGHTTASDALWVGLPVLTRRGTSFASRVAASLLTAVGLDELITDSQAEFERKAIALAKDPAQIASLRATLMNLGRSSPLFDIQSFTRDFEALLEKMVERQRAGQPCADLQAC
jgi:predicted O-linked N-acetylglucosamine transferase (SPINDLY family)